jgi:hypothetical protein
LWPSRSLFASVFQWHSRLFRIEQSLSSSIASARQVIIKLNISLPLAKLVVSEMAHRGNKRDKRFEGV